MKRYVDAMIYEGYSAKQIISFEKCKQHEFRNIQYFNVMNGECGVQFKCIHCLLDVHGAQLMGVDPKELNNPEDYT